MKKIALLAVSTLFVVACSDENRSVMGNKIFTEQNGDLVASSVVFTAGQNEADFSGCIVGPNDLDPERFKKVTCPSTNGLTVEEAVEVNKINVASLAEIKNDVVGAWATDDRGLMSPHKGKELQEIMDAANREDALVKAVDTEIQSGLMMAEHAEELIIEADVKEKDHTENAEADLEDLRNKLTLQKMLLSDDSSDVPSVKALNSISEIKAEIAAIQNRPEEIKALRAESQRLKLDSEYKIVNSTVNAENNIFDSERDSMTIEINFIAPEETDANLDNGALKRHQ